jgi:hypothetical protein
MLRSGICPVDSVTLARVRGWIVVSRWAAGQPGAGFEVDSISGF